MMPNEYTIAHLTTLDEFERCVQLQGAIWGYEDNDIVPRRMFLLARKIGGQVIGAFRSQREAKTAENEQGREASSIPVQDPAHMVGFAMALPGFRDGTPYLHSHMLAVLPEHRNAGLGRRMKLAQRDDAIARGFHLMEWTFDPLEIKNAFLNIAKLGAVARRYQPDFYGPSSSPLQAGLPTDRLYAEWWLRSSRVESALGLTPAVSNPVEQSAVVERITLPHSIIEWKRNPELRTKAQQLQQQVRTSFQEAFARGLTVLDFERNADGDGTYVLGYPEPTALKPPVAAPKDPL
jgi:predicted GNAT superfamily acetyltransferase